MDSPTDAVELRLLLQRFIRDFGLLSPEQTPCGQPLATSHAHALMVLLERERSRQTPTQKELASELGLDKSNVARLCKRLEDAGQLEQSRAADDRRMSHLRLTAAGRRMAVQVERASQERFSSLLAHVPAGQRGRVLAALRVLSSALEELKQDP